MPTISHPYSKFYFLNLQLITHKSHTPIPILISILMTEEYQDSDILFPENASRNRKEIQYSIVEKKNNKKTRKKRSAPMNIREEFPRGSWVREYLQTHSFDEEDVREEEIVPPHVILDRRIAGKAAFSLCSGIGRTLKGRDLSEVRNSILRMTGFIES
ncbi:putative senescence regulator S40 [Helianthus anomalus]